MICGWPTGSGERVCFESEDVFVKCHSIPGARGGGFEVERVFNYWLFVYD